MAAKRPGQPHPTHFLVIEDDDDHADLILGMLQQQGLNRSAERLADGAAALAYFDDVRAGEHPCPDVILLDLKLPKVDGLEVLDRIKKDETLCLTPVVILTTSDAEADRARAYKNRANSYLVKPVNYAQFEALLEDLSTYWGAWNAGPR